MSRLRSNKVLTTIALAGCAVGFLSIGFRAIRLCSVGLLCCKKGLQKRKAE